MFKAIKRIFTNDPLREMTIPARQVTWDTVKGAMARADTDDMADSVIRVGNAIDKAFKVAEPAPVPYMQKVTESFETAVETSSANIEKQRKVVQEAIALLIDYEVSHDAYVNGLCTIKDGATSTASQTSETYNKIRSAVASKRTGKLDDTKDQ